MGGAQSKSSGGLFHSNGPPPVKGKNKLNVFGAIAKATEKPDPLAKPVTDPTKPAAPDPLVLKPDASKPNQTVGVSGAIVPVGGMQTVPVAPTLNAQTMLNATPAGVGAGGYGSAPAANPVSMPVAAPQAAVLKPAVAAAAQANQTTTGANQFAAPNMNGITFGGS